jgi:ribosomal protein L37AE/L43A
MSCGLSPLSIILLNGHENHLCMNCKSFFSYQDRKKEAIEKCNQCQKLNNCKFESNNIKFEAKRL